VLRHQSQRPPFRFGQENAALFLQIEPGQAENFHQTIAEDFVQRAILEGVPEDGPQGGGHRQVAGGIGFGLQSPANVAEQGDRPGNMAVLNDGGDGEFHRNGGAVAPPVHITGNMPRIAVMQGLPDRAGDGRKVTAVGTVVMGFLVQVEADSLVLAPSQHAPCRRIDERDPPLGVDPADAFAGRAENQFEAVVGLLGLGMGLLEG
jgi:hypothetical protein